MTCLHQLIEFANMQLAYRHDERPGESYKALDGKKAVYENKVGRGCFGCGFACFWFLVGLVCFRWVLFCFILHRNGLLAVYWSYFSTAFAVHLLNKMD